MVQRLRELGMPLSYEDVLRQAGDVPAGAPPHRPGPARGGVRESVKEAFDRWLHRGGPAYVPREKLSPAEAVQAIIDAGGVPVLAHPGRIDGQWVIQELIDAGLEGLECYYPEHTPEQTERYLGLAREHGLVVTGGTDYHGPLAPRRRSGVVAGAAGGRGAVERTRAGGATGPASGLTRPAGPRRRGLSGGAWAAAAGPRLRRGPSGGAAEPCGAAACERAGRPRRRGRGAPAVHVGRGRWVAVTKFPVARSRHYVDVQGQTPFRSAGPIHLLGFLDVELWAEGRAPGPPRRAAGFGRAGRGHGPHRAGGPRIHAPFRGLDLTSPDPGVRNRAVSVLSRTIEMAGRLDCPYVVVHVDGAGERGGRRCAHPAFGRRRVRRGDGRP